MVKASMAPSPLPQTCGHTLPLPLLKILDQPLQLESKQSHSSYNAGISTKSMGTPKVTCTQLIYSLGTVKDVIYIQKLWTTRAKRVDDVIQCDVSMGKFLLSLVTPQPTFSSMVMSAAASFPVPLVSGIPDPYTS